MNELHEDIKLLCKPCHEKLHREANKRKRERAKRGEKAPVKKQKQKKANKSIVPQITASQKAIQDRYNALGVKPMLKKIDIRQKKQASPPNPKTLQTLASSKQAG